MPNPIDVMRIYDALPLIHSFISLWNMIHRIGGLESCASGYFNRPVKYVLFKGTDSFGRKYINIPVIDPDTNKSTAFTIAEHLSDDKTVIVYGGIDAPKVFGRVTAADIDSIAHLIMIGHVNNVPTNGDCPASYILDDIVEDND